MVETGRLLLGASASTMETTLRFDDDREAQLELDSVAFAVARVRPSGWSPRAAAGLLTGGDLFQDGGTSHRFDGGFFLALGLDKQLAPGEGVRPAVDMSLGLSAAWAQTQERRTGTKADYSATDLRVGMRAVWPVGQRLFPYAAARVFGGPVNWTWADDDVQGSDIHHYQMALGVAAAFGRMAMQLEWGAVGEKSLSAGVSSFW